MSKSLSYNFKTIFFYNLISSILAYVFIGIASRYLDEIYLSTWFWLVALISFFSFTDFYLHQFLQNKISRFWDNEEKTKSKFSEIYSYVIVILIILATAQALIFLLIGSFFGYEVVSENIFFISLILWVVGIIQAFQLSIAILTGLGKAYEAAIWNLVRTFLQYSGTLLSFLIIGFEKLFLAYLSGVLFVLIYSIILEKNVRSRFGLIFTFPKDGKSIFKLFADFKSEIGFSWPCLRIVDAFKINAPLLVGFFYVSNTYYAEYSLLSRFNLVLNLIGGAVMTPLLPKLVELLRYNDRIGYVRLVKKVLSMFFLLGFLYVLAMMMMTDFIFNLWIGKPSEASHLYQFLTFLSGVLLMFAQFAWTLMVSIERLNILIVTTVGSVIISLTIFLADESLGDWVLPLSYGVPAFFLFCICWLNSVIYLGGGDAKYY